MIRHHRHSAYNIKALLNIKLFLEICHIIRQACHDFLFHHIVLFLTHLLHHLGRFGSLLLSFFFSQILMVKSFLIFLFYTLYYIFPFLCFISLHLRILLNNIVILIKVYILINSFQKCDNTSIYTILKHIGGRSYEKHRARTTS